MNESDTPRVNANATYRDGSWECVDADFARTLERELNAANARIAELTKLNELLVKGMMS